MISGLRFVGTLMVAGFLATSVGASADNQKGWERFSSVNGSLSAEMPCEPNGSEVVEARSALDNTPLTVELKSRLSCMTSGVVFLARIESMPADSESKHRLFDLLTVVAAAGVGQPNGPEFIDLRGRRAVVSRRLEESAFIQTSFVEVSEREVVGIEVSGPASDGESTSEIEAMFDRFLSTLEVVK